MLIGTPPVSNLIREAKTFQIPSIMQTGKQIGMVPAERRADRAGEARLVAPEEAYAKAVDKTGLLGLYKRAGMDVSWAPKDAAPVAAQKQAMDSRRLAACGSRLRRDPAFGRVRRCDPRLRKSAAG